MSIPTTLTIFVPDGASQPDIDTRTALREALMSFYVERLEDFPTGHDGAAYSTACREFFHAHPGLLAVSTFGGTLIFREYASTGEHPFKASIPLALDYDHHNDAEGSTPAQYQVRRGAHLRTWPSDNEEVLLISAEKLSHILSEAQSESALRAALSDLCNVPPPSYSVGSRRYEEDWE